AKVRHEFPQRSDHQEGKGGARNDPPRRLAGNGGEIDRLRGCGDGVVHRKPERTGVAAERIGRGGMARQARVMGESPGLRARLVNPFSTRVNSFLIYISCGKQSRKSGGNLFALYGKLVR